ncbi:MAG: bacteriohemerythrin [Nitrospirae bacterium]|nr:bacteriohemerythrin [Nitrospirota bacterium]
MALFTWDDRFSVNVREIDEQHKRLIGMINELHDGMKSGGGKAAVAPILKRLVDYTLYHFSTEERYMAQHRYPGELAHKTEHKKFTDKVMDFHKKFDAGTAAVSLELMTFLKSWLTDHIMVTDKKYSKHFNDHGLK